MVVFLILGDEEDPEGTNVVPKGKLLAYLNPVVIEKLESDNNEEVKSSQKPKVIPTPKRRVVDRDDLQPLIPGFPTQLT